MKGNKGFWVLAVALVVLVAGALILYKNLSQGYQGNLLVRKEAEEGLEQEAEETEPAEEETEQTKDAEADTTSEEAAEKETEQETEAAQETLTMAPTFSVTDSEGNQVNLTDFYGKPIVVNFWASWCGPCKSEMPDFEEAYQRYGEEVNFLMVNMTDGARETIEDAQAYVNANGYTFPVYYDVEQDAAITYGVTSIPSTYFIDKEGHAIAYAQGAISSDVLQTGLDMIDVQQ